MNSRPTPHLLLPLLVLALCQTTLHAQWLTQSFQLKQGWTAIYAHIDATHATLDQLVADDPTNPIEEIQMWSPVPSTLQFITTPQDPSSGDSQWLTWRREIGSINTLSRLTANAAYLVRVGGAAPTYTWNLKGRPVPLNYQWTTTGLNFLGFPTPTSAAPTFDALFNSVPDLKRAAEIYYYTGGEFGPNNPMKLFALRTQPAVRGQAYWIRSGGVFNRYFGPLEIQLATPSGVNFRDDLSQSRLVIRNLDRRAVTVTLQVIPTETPPAGQTAIIGAPPLLLRGALNTTDLTYSFSHLNAAPQSWSLEPQGQIGSEAEVVLGLNRAQMTGNPGDLHAAVLRFTDSLNLSQIDVPLSALVGSTAGLWVGSASVSQVQHYLKAFAKNPDGSPVTGPDGGYTVTNTDQSLGSVSRPFPLRLIIHNDNASQAVLLQRVYFGISPTTNQVIATQESALATTQLAAARRISSVHLPWSTANQPWAFSGNLRQGGTLTATVTLNYDDQASNPYLHTYHPDHDNLDATFEQRLPQGVESFGVRRQITLTVTPPSEDFVSLTSGSQTLGGTYQETVTFLGNAGGSRAFDVAGSFRLNRLSTIATLTTN